AQIMIDAIDLFFIQRFVDLFVQVTRRFQICAKRLFNHDTPPAIIFGELTCLGKLVNNVGEDPRWRCHVINAVSRTRLPVLQHTLKFFKIFRIVITTLTISKIRSEVIPLPLRVLKRSELLQPFFQMPAEFFVSECRAAEANDAEFFRHSPLAVQVKYGWHKLTLCQISGCPKDNNGYG